MGNERKQKELRRKRRKERAATKAAKPRECGGCTACCTAMAIPEVPTEVGEPCKHECAMGCAIYTTRPSRCQGFRCAWLDGWGSKANDRPDKHGWLAYVDRGFPQFNTVAGGGSRRGSILVVREAVSGAASGAHFEEVLRDWIGHGSAVLVKTAAGMTLYGPKIPAGVRFSQEELERLSGANTSSAG